MSCGHNCRISPEIATEGRRKSLVRQVKKHMDFRITADGNERDIREIRAAVELPLIGLIKQRYEGYFPYITPTLKEVGTGHEVACFRVTGE